MKIVCALAKAQARQLVRKVLFPSSSFLFQLLVHFNLFVTSALLPQPVREMFGLQWNERQQRDFDHLAHGLRAVLPSLPACMRELPSTRRMIRHLRSAQGRGAPLQKWANDGPSGMIVGEVESCTLYSFE
jgi:uncharacterized protein (DUF2236 family)